MSVSDIQRENGVSACFWSWALLRFVCESRSLNVFGHGLSNSWSFDWLCCLFCPEDAPEELSSADMSKLEGP